LGEPEKQKVDWKPSNQAHFYNFVNLHREPYFDPNKKDNLMLSLLAVLKTTSPGLQKFRKYLGSSCTCANLILCSA